MMEKRFLLFLLIIANFGLLNADLTIDGKGNEWNLLARGILSIPTGNKLTLKDVNVNKLSASRLVVHHSTSQLVLENSSLSLDGNYSFTHGSLVIKGDCTITGTTGTLFTFNGHHILIDYNSTLKIKNITFQPSPTSKIHQLIKYGNQISKLLLENATLKVNNITNGLAMVSGNLVIEGSSTIDNTSTDTAYALQLGNGADSSSNCNLVIRKNSKLTVDNAGVVFKNIGSGSLNLSAGQGTLEAETGNFLIENQVNLNNSTFNFNFSTLKGMAKNTFSSLSSPISSNHADTVTTVAWSPNGEYLAIGGATAGPVTHRIYSFNGSSLSELLGCKGNHGAVLRCCNWNPDGIHFAIGGIDFNNVTHRVYSFDGATLTPLDTADHDTVVRDISWSPDGRYLSIVGDQNGVDKAHCRVYSFNGSNITELIKCRKNFDNASYAITLSWSPDGKYLTIGGNVTDTNQNLKVYYFDENSLTEICHYLHGTVTNAVFWSPNGKYFAIGGSRVDEGGGVFVTHRILRLDGNNLIEIANADNTHYIDKLCWNFDGKYLLTGNNLVEAYNFDGDTLSSIFLITLDSDYRTYSWHPSGRYFALGGVYYLSFTHKVYQLFYSGINPLSHFQNATLNLGGKNFKLNNIELRGY